MLEKILSFNPWCEVFIKWLYWRSSGLRQMLKPVVKRMRRNQSQTKAYENFNQLKQIIKRLNISPNDILLIHSSFTQLRLEKVMPEELLDYLLKFIVPDGTLVLPSMPILKDTNGKIMHYPGDPEQIGVFDLKKSIPWTGDLARKLIRYEGAKRWWNPLNNVVAVGVHAGEMMLRDPQDYQVGEIYPSGIGTPWDYMVKKNAKILSLGTDLVHSLTMIHYEEDVKARLWPIRDWYQMREFLVIDGEKKFRLETNERKPKWAINFAERTLRKRLLKSGLLFSTIFNGAKVEFIETSDLIDHLKKYNTNGYPYFTLNRKL